MNSFREEIRDAAGMKKHAWTCTKCHEPCPLTLVDTPEPRFRSACHVAEVRPTKGYERLAEVQLGTEDDPTNQHTVLMTLDGVTQCLSCGLWTRTNVPRLKAIACQPPASEDEEVPLGLLEVT